LFTLSDFGRLFKIENQNTLYKKIQRLEKKKIIKEADLRVLKIEENFLEFLDLLSFLKQNCCLRLPSKNL